MAKIQVPDHILDYIAERAEDYTQSSHERLLGHFTAEKQSKIEAQSTHHLVRTEERRELHKTILEAIIQDMPEKTLNKPLLIQFIGPMASGKTTLQMEFLTRLNSDDPNTPYHDDTLEHIYQLYAQASQYKVTSDFELYKSMLPEFKENDQEFAIIRAEASGLDQAVQKWSKELNSSIILEQLGDTSADKESDITSLSAKNTLITVAVTSDPTVNAQRLHQRNQEKDEHISDQELARTIQQFSATSYDLYAKHSVHTALINSTQGNFEPIHLVTQGNEKIINAVEFKNFRDNKHITLDNLRPAPGGQIPSLDR